MTPNLGQGGCTALEVSTAWHTIKHCYQLTALHECKSLTTSRSEVRLFWLYSGSAICTEPCPHAIASGMQDGVVLARALQRLLRHDAIGSGGSTSSGGRGSGVTAAELEATLRQFEADRRKRVLPLTLRSHAFGRLLQLPFPPVSTSLIFALLATEVARMVAAAMVPLRAISILVMHVLSDA